MRIFRTPRHEVVPTPRQGTGTHGVFDNRTTRAACPFCNIINGHADANIVYVGFDSIGIVPLHPVVDGHVLFIPRGHVANAFEAPITAAATMCDAARWAGSAGGSRYYSANLITSVGRAATQTVRHLHIHIVPRAEGDGLPLPWTPQQEVAL